MITFFKSKFHRGFFFTKGKFLLYSNLEYGTMFQRFKLGLTYSKDLKVLYVRLIIFRLLWETHIGW